MKQNWFNLIGDKNRKNLNILKDIRYMEFFQGCKYKTYFFSSQQKLRQ